MRLFVATLSATGLLLGSTSLAGANPGDSNPTINNREAMASGLIIQVADSAITNRSIDVIESKADLEIVDSSAMASEVQVLEFAEAADAETVTDAVLAAESRPEILSAEPNWFVYPTVINKANPFANSDTYFAQQYGLWDPRNTGGQYSVKAPELWKYATGASDIKVAVLDTGVNSHPDLANRVLSGYDFFAGDKYANDPGKVWHGTAVASLIAANDDGRGIIGVAPDVTILPIRVLNDEGGEIADVIKGIRWAADRGAKVINMSLSTGPNTPCDSTDTWTGQPQLRDAIAHARAKGAVIIAARGNLDTGDSTSDLATATLPSSCDGVIGVASTRDDGTRASYSYHTVGTDIAAPGGAGDGAGSGQSEVWVAAYGGGWKPNAGTSFAAPLVSGAAALMFSMGYAQSEIEAALGQGQTATAVQAAKNCAECGAGILDLSKVSPRIRMVSAAVISGAAVAGTTLKATSEWSGANQETYQWLRDGVPIQGATSSSFKLSRADLGTVVTFSSTASTAKIAPDSGTIPFASGTTQNFSQTSTSSVTPPRAAVTGTMRAYRTVTWGSSTIKSNWPATSSGYRYKYQWYRYNSGKYRAISNAATYTYRIRSADRGKYIRVKVTAYKDGLPTFVSTSPGRKVAR